LPAPAFHNFNGGSGPQGLGSFLCHHQQSSTTHGVERQESLNEFPARGFIVITEVGVAERAEQKQDGVQVGIRIKKRTPGRSYLCLAFCMGDHPKPSVLLLTSHIIQIDYHYLTIFAKLLTSLSALAPAEPL
jgi:hypothetical protein